MNDPPDTLPASITTASVPTDWVVADTDYRAMVDAVLDYAIFFMDRHGRILTWNAGAHALTGYGADEAIGQDVAFFYPSELVDVGGPAHELKTAAERGHCEEEGWRLHKNGTRFWASIVVTRLGNPDGSLKGFSAIVRDLTSRQRHEEQLRASEERFRLIVDGVKDYAIFMLDPTGHVVSWNTGARTTKGYEAAEIIGKHFSVFYPPEVVASGFPELELKAALETGRYEDEGWRLRKDGSRFWASVVITALFDKAGNHRGFAKVTRDLTERRRVRALEDEGRRIATFLAMLGHELRNPLAPIANVVEILERQAVEPQIKRLTAVASRQVRQITRLVDDLLDVGRIAHGKIHLELKPVRLATVVMEAIEATKPLRDAKRHLLDVELRDSSAWVSGDHTRLVQVVSNLLHNAAKFTPPGGRLKVRLDTAQGRAEISVADNGPGIAPQDLPGIFNLFTQGDQDISRPQGGLGLGLTLVQNIAALHGGDVSAFSKGVAGEGSEFIVSLPTIAAPIEAPEQPGPQTGKRVLVVDDNQDAAETLSLMVEALGYFPSTVFDGDAALRAIKSTQADVVLLDIGLPGLSGWEVAQKVRSEVADPPALIAVSGFGQPADRAKSLELGFHEHFTKPVQLDQLSAVLKRLIGSS
ncbi:PAS domain S-box protein [Variovorax sp. J22R24]|uniref:PAS domain-containing hybrid sensor histidine kinase/response regulator n=1 Tax=Variovorax gracilis TaxID=3053502 RepID=UPI002578CE1C|nr:PAS domain S-box protein [Variovorax sp. J22R24]MDM0109340.1 PAS domain S-box protein [Variovorax sp. J22R24]